MYSDKFEPLSVGSEGRIDISKYSKIRNFSCSILVSYPDIVPVKGPVPVGVSWYPDIVPVKGPVPVGVSWYSDIAPAKGS